MAIPSRTLSHKVTCEGDKMNKQKYRRIWQSLKTYIDPYRILWLLLSMPLRYEGGPLYLLLSLLAELLFLCRILTKRNCKAFEALFALLVLLVVTVLTVSAGCEGPTCDISTR